MAERRPRRTGCPGVEFVTYVGHELVSSPGKSRDAVRSIDLDEGIVRILRMQRLLQKQERLVAEKYEESDYVFTKPIGGPYHPQYLLRMLSSYTEELASRGSRRTVSATRAPL